MRYVVCQGTSNRKVPMKTKYKAIGLYSGAGFLRVTFAGLLFGRVYFRGGFSSEFYS